VRARGGRGEGEGWWHEGASLVEQAEIIGAAAAGEHAWDAASAPDLARLLPRLVGSLQALALPAPALAALAEPQPQHQGGGAPGPGPLAVQLTRLSVLQLVGSLECEGLQSLGGAGVLVLPALRHLCAAGAGRLFSLDGLGPLAARLETLALSDFSSLTGLGACTSVRALQLARCGIESPDLEPLAGLDRLTALDLSANKLRSLAPLAGLTSLTGDYAGRCVCSFWFEKIGGA
jgi:hypothetical protein